MMNFTTESGFWVFNQLSNFAYTRANIIYPDIRKKQAELELKFIDEVQVIDEVASKLYEKDPEKAISFLTDYSVNSGNQTVDTWRELYGFLFAKFMDGNIKEAREVPENYIYVTPKVDQPGYGEEWYRIVVKETGDKLKRPEENQQH